MIERIKKIIKQGEGPKVEFKKAYYQVPVDVYETVCAFLNTDGGEIFLGINNDGVIEGVLPDAVEKMKSDFITTINSGSKIHPTVICDINTINIDNKIVLYIQVEESSQVYKCDNKIYIRQGACDIDKTNDNEFITKLYQNKSSIYSENKIYPFVQYSDLREDLLEKAKTIAIRRNPNHLWRDLDYKTILKKSSLYYKDYATGEEGYTLAAVLLFGSDDLIHDILPSFKIDLVKRVDNPLRYDDRIDLRTNLIESYDLMINFVNKYLPNPFYFDGDSRINLRDIIFRELVANMLVHKEYLRPEATKLIIERDIITTENSNRPHMKGIINIKNLTPYPKNPNISKFFRQLGRVEELGSGVENLLKYSKKYFGYMPVIDDNDIFKVTVKHEFFPIIKKKKSTKKQYNAQLDLFNDYVHSTPQAEGNTPQAEGNTPQAEGNTPQAEEFSLQVVEYCIIPRTLNEIMKYLQYKDRKNFKKKIDKLVDKNLIRLTIPEKPTSPKQKYVKVD